MPEPTEEWNPSPVDRQLLHQNREQIRVALDKLVAQARIDVPADYDLEAAFADVLSLGAVDAPPSVQPAIVRIALYLFDRLPKE